MLRSAFPFAVLMSKPNWDAGAFPEGWLPTTPVKSTVAKLVPFRMEICVTVPVPPDAWATDRNETTNIKQTTVLSMIDFMAGSFDLGGNCWFVDLFAPHPGLG